MKEMKMGKMRFLEEGRENGDYLASFMRMTWFYVAIWKMIKDKGEMYWRRGLKINAYKSMVLGREERLGCEVLVNGMQLEHVSEFKYLGCVLDKFGTNQAKCWRSVVSGRKSCICH